MTSSSSSSPVKIKLSKYSKIKAAHHPRDSHLWYKRGGNIISFTLNTLLITVTLFYFSSYFDSNKHLIPQLLSGQFGTPLPLETAKLSIDSFSRLRRFPASQVAFSIDLDLSPWWNWNTKELYLFLVVEYDTSGPQGDIHIHNTIWNHTILSIEDAILSPTDQLTTPGDDPILPPYNFPDPLIMIDPESPFRPNTDFKFSLYINRVHYAGSMIRRFITSETFIPQNWASHRSTYYSPN